MSDLLGIGASGVTAYRNALSVVGDNIVNAETPGYARRRAVQAEVGVATNTNAIYKPGLNLGGVATQGVARAWDDFKAADSRLASATAARTDARVRWLSTVEGALDDGATGVGESVTAVFTAGDTLASDPGNIASRRAFLATIDSAADAFRTTEAALARASDGIAGEAGTAVAAANADIGALSKLNIQIRRAAPGSAAFAQLSDERDRLLDDLSDRVEISVALGSDGAAHVTLPRTGGLVLVDRNGQDSAALSAVTSASGRIAHALFTDGESRPVTFAAGSLAGLAGAAATVADRRDRLDTLATGFATALNDWSVVGTDANGAPGTALLTVDPDNAAGSIAAAVADRDPATVAAALIVTTTIDNGDGTTSTTSRTVANGNLLNLSATRAAAGTEQGWANLVSSQSQILASAKAEDTTAAARKTAAFAARDAVAGIDLDTEASDLLRFQQAYNGSAKIIQVARETLQAIFDIL